MDSGPTLPFALRLNRLHNRVNWARLRECNAHAFDRISISGSSAIADRGRMPVVESERRGKRDKEVDKQKARKITQHASSHSQGAGSNNQKEGHCFAMYHCESREGKF